MTSQVRDNGLYFGGIEAGDTKFNCIVATGPDDVLRCARIPTTSPQETLAQVIALFRECALPLRAIGPVDPDPRSPTLSPARRSPAGATPISSARSAAR